MGTEIPRELQPKIDELRARVAGAQTPADRLEALLLLVDELVAVTPFACEPLLLQARELARELGDKASEARVESNLASTALQSDDLDAVETHARRALALAREAGDGAREASALSLLAILYRTRTDYDRARECAQLCRAVSEKAGYPRGVLSALNGLGNLAMLQGQLEEALGCYQQCLEVNAELGDDFSGAACHVNVGLVQEQLGRWEDAADNLYRAVALGERHGFAALRHTALNMLGEIFLKRDKLDRAVETLRFVADAGRGKLTTQTVRRDALSNVGQAYCRRGDLASASRTFAEALELCRNAGDRREQAVLLWRTAEVALLRGSPDRAQALADEALGLARELGLRTEEGEALRVHGLIAAGRGNTDAARVAFAAALEALAGSDEGYELARARCQYGRYLLELGDTRTAADMLRAAAKVFRRLAIVADAEEAIQLLFRLEMGNDRDTALLQAISSITALSLEPARFVKQCLRLLCEGLGFESGALLAENRAVLVRGNPNLARGQELARRAALAVSDTTLSFPVNYQDQTIGSVYLERPVPSMTASDTVIAGAVGNLLAAPVRLLIQGRQETSGPDGLELRGFVGCDARVQPTLRRAAQLAGTAQPVLIRGEKGTGRKLLARALHDSGAQGPRRFVVLQCMDTDVEVLAELLFGAGGIRGRLEESDWGTVCLEDVGELSPGLQARLLDWLNGPGSEPGAPRVITTTSRHLGEPFGGGAFNPALYQLLAKAELGLLPLRERIADIAGLAGFLVRQSDREFNRGATGLSAEAIERLAAHDWPGNIAELQRVLERAVLLARGPLVEVEDLPEDLPKSGVSGSSP
jgi:tetratricopeptide (TPR) repeat protein